LSGAPIVALGSGGEAVPGGGVLGGTGGPLVGGGGVTDGPEVDGAEDPGADGVSDAAPPLGADVVGAGGWLTPAPMSVSRLNLLGAPIALKV
jgi:hypothetical protein